MNKWHFLAAVLIVIVAGCSQPSVNPDRGGYYNGDSPPEEMIVNPNLIPDAEPRSESLSKTGNSPYQALGKSYRPLKTAVGFTEKGVASWYGKKFHGRKTSSGEQYDMWAMTAAHPVLPLPSYVKVVNLDNGRTAVVKVNDRGPFLHNRIIDLSYAAALKLGIAEKGTGRVEITVLNPDGNVSEPVPSDNISQTKYSGSLGGEQALSDRYYIQVAAYMELANAIAMRTALQVDGFSLFPNSKEEQISLGAPYRVQVGPFTRMEKAISIKNRLELQYGVEMRLISF